MHNVLTSSPSARFIPVAVSGLLVVALAVACTTGPAGSPSPTAAPGSPTPIPTPTPTASPAPPTASPTATPIPSPTFAADQIRHPTGPTEVVLQMEQGGGFVPLESIITNAPSFNLYGDGTLILRPAEPDDPLAGVSFGPPRFIQMQLTEEQVQALLRVALGQGRLLDAKDHYPTNTCADCQSTTFTINAADISKKVVVDALTEIDMGEADPVDRRAFAELVQVLNGFEQRARNGELGEVTLYDPQLYRVVLMEAQGGVRGGGEWPWPDLTIEDFPVEGDSFQRIAVLSRELVAMVVEVLIGGVGAIVVEAPNDILWSIGIRPQIGRAHV